MSERARPRPKSQLILASTSPRRRQILALAGVSFRAIGPGIKEEPPQPLPPLRLARWAADAKARAVAPRFRDGVVLAADTVVALDGRTYGKPRSRAQASATLRALSGRTHIVYTAVTVLARSRRASGFSRTFVTMRELSPGVIRRYVESGEAQDKAGAYAIQGEGRRLVRTIRGPFDNVVGMPMHLVLRLLRESGLKVPAIKANEAGQSGDSQRQRSSSDRHRRLAATARRERPRRLRPGDQLAAGGYPELGRKRRS